MTPVALLVLAFPLLVRGADLTPEVRAIVESRAKTLLAWGTEPNVGEAGKACNAAPTAEAKATTNEEWKSLQVLDPFARSFTRNALTEHRQSKRDASATELFVSGVSSGRLVCFAITSSWNHKTRPQYSVPIPGKTWFGPVEVDESAGQQQVQVGIPVLDGSGLVGSNVVGRSFRALLRLNAIVVDQPLRGENTEASLKEAGQPLADLTQSVSAVTGPSHTFSKIVRVVDEVRAGSEQRS